MTGSAEGPQPAPRIVRAQHGRLLGGVCAGLPDVGGLGTNGKRLLFVIAALLGGIGIVAYVACWLVIPPETQDPDSDPVRSVVLLAWATGGLVALVLIAAAAAAATVFGLGWAVFAVAAILAGLTFSPLRTRIPTVVVLLTLGALTLPAVAVALSPLRLTFQSGQSVATPKTYRALRQTVYRSGFGTLLIDLRHTAPIKVGENATLRIDAGLRRTIVALPTNACVRVRINYDIHLFPDHFAALLTGHFETPFHDVVLFGRPYGYGAGGATSSSTDAGGSTVFNQASGSSGVVITRGGAGPSPLLTIDFTSQGGGLYVRDYPGSVDPNLVPQWPGYPVTLEPRPVLRGEPLKVRRQMVRAWHRRLLAERISQQQINSELPGPCVA